MIVVRLQRLKFALIKARQNKFPLLSQLGQQLFQFAVVPLTGNFIERQVERLFLLLWQIDNGYLRFLNALRAEDGVPLVAADNVACTPVPDDRLN